ncbi:hypothetical protein [Lysinibacillus boronitolerans]|nr:hypothetical protein [Lysinibacillus boronitolerans]
MAKFWCVLMNFKLLNEDLTNQLLLSHVELNESDGYGVWIKNNSE